MAPRSFTFARVARLLLCLSIVLSLFAGLWPAGARAAAQEGGPSTVYFPETGHHVADPFLATWRRLGGLETFGYPLTEAFEEDGMLVQYFERARFEWHPENAGTPHEILLGRLGADRAAFLGHDTSAVARQEGVPDYSESLWTPPPSEPRSIDLPILIYHRFGDYPERYQVTFTEFERQLDWLQANGYTTVTMSEVYDSIAGIGSLPARPVVLTFDDGWASQWRAAQAMTARGMRGVFFVTTRQNGLDLATLASWGHEIGGHTISHPDLTTLSDWQLAQELTASRQQLQAWSGQSVDILAYPYGAYDARVIAAAQAAGYRGAVAAWGGTYLTPDRWWVEPRVEVSGFHSLADFAAIVS